MGGTGPGDCASGGGGFTDDRVAAARGGGWAAGPRLAAGALRTFGPTGFDGRDVEALADCFFESFLTAFFDGFAGRIA